MSCTAEGDHGVKADDVTHGRLRQKDLARHRVGSTMGCVVRLDDVVQFEESVACGENEQPVGLQCIGRLAACPVVGADVRTTC